MAPPPSTAATRAGDAAKRRDNIERLSFVMRVNASASAFKIDVHEVTNEQYAYCVELGDCTPPAFSGIAGIDDYYENPDYRKHPVVWVDWPQANAYCQSRGGFLPSEVQWELAARGAKGDRTFPWGDEPAPCENPNSTDYVADKDCNRANNHLGPNQVGFSQKDKTELNVFDMASNVKEWTASVWSAYSYCAVDEPCQEGTANCQEGCYGWGLCVPANNYPTAAGSGLEREHVVRGGSFKGTPCDQRLFVRRRETQAREDLGFRCAYDET
jgi:formylglycine-generating enzyme required for sulfatase activity